MEPFVNSGKKYPKVNNALVDKMLDEVCEVEKSLAWYKVPKDDIERAAITSKLLGIFYHHFMGNVHLYVFGRDLYEKSPSDKNAKFAEEFKSIIETEFKNMSEFTKDAKEGKYPDRIVLWDNKNYTTYTAVYVDRNSPAKIKRLLKRSDIKAEIKRVKDIVKRGGAWYYDEMLKELNEGVGGNRYLIVDE